MNQPVSQIHLALLHRQEFLDAAKQTLAMASNGGLPNRDVAPLFEIYQKFGDAQSVGDLERSANQWNFYSMIALAHLPEGATNFTTIELKSNFLGTAKTGTIACVARPAHLGRNTQVWDATVTHKDTGKTIALFRCTQMVLWPKD